MRWSYTPHSHTFTNILYLGFNHTDNALTRGYTYDTSTGVRYNRMYNVSGNTMKAVTNELRWQFGATKQFTLSSESDFNLSTYSDMIGVNMEEPEHTKVKHRSMSEKMKFMWQFGAHSLQVRCDLTNRHTTSTQPDFDNLNANHLNYGISGLFKLPAGFAINTDFTCYTRRGYGVDYLDTTDPVWNARLSYCPPRNSRWVFMIEAVECKLRRHRERPYGQLHQRPAALYPVLIPVPPQYPAQKALRASSRPQSAIREMAPGICSCSPSKMVSETGP